MAEEDLARRFGGDPPGLDETHLPGGSDARQRMFGSLADLPVPNTGSTACLPIVFSFSSFFFFCKATSRPRVLLKLFLGCPLKRFGLDWCFGGVNYRSPSQKRKVSLTSNNQANCRFEVRYVLLPVHPASLLRCKAAKSKVQDFHPLDGAPESIFYFNREAGVSFSSWDVLDAQNGVFPILLGVHRDLPDSLRRFFLLYFFLGSRIIAEPRISILPLVQCLGGVTLRSDTRGLSRAHL